MTRRSTTAGCVAALAVDGCFGSVGRGFQASLSGASLRRGGGERETRTEKEKERGPVDENPREFRQRHAKSTIKYKIHVFFNGGFLYVNSGQVPLPPVGQALRRNRVKPDWHFWATTPHSAVEVLQLLVGSDLTREPQNPERSRHLSKVVGDWPTLTDSGQF